MDKFEQGKRVGIIPVKISYRIIELFSDGLYSSPNKAIEELVSNSYDAGASKVGILLSSDLGSQNASIAVIDNGTGMDKEGLRNHWHIGASRKRGKGKTPKGRLEIGKFGIGKLATFALARKLTHLTKQGGKFLMVTMDYSAIPQGEFGGIELKNNKEGVNLNVRELTVVQAKDVLESSLEDLDEDKVGFKLFGKGSARSWTVALMRDLKNTAQELKRGQLRWVLQNAMPIGDDFSLLLHGEQILSKRIEQSLLKRWTLGNPSDPLDTTPEGFEPATKSGEIGLKHPQLGKISGYFEIYDTVLPSDRIGRSNGFFVYVRGRLINLFDSHFGISPNALRHGTFSRFRMVLHVDKLDDDLRSSRETIRDAKPLEITQKILHSAFNTARNWLEQHERETTSEFLAASRIEQASASLTRWPLINLLELAFRGEANPVLLEVPRDIAPGDVEGILANVRQEYELENGLQLTIKTEDGQQDDPIAKFNPITNILTINALHPFVANYRDSFESEETLSLLSMAEILNEAYLYSMGFTSSSINDVLQKRDQLLRQFAKYKRKRTINQIAKDLEEAVTDDDLLEDEVVAAFDSLGFDTSKLAKTGEPDGYAEAHLAAGPSGKRSYTLTIEVKSKEKAGTIVSAKAVGISTVARHREAYNADHAIVVAEQFPTTRGAGSALMTEVAQNREATGKTITLITTRDLARLVKLRALKHLDLEKLRELFSLSSPEEVSDWIDNLTAMKIQERHKQLHRVVLQTIWDLQTDDPGNAISYDSVRTVLRREKEIDLGPEELRNLCKALALFARGIDAQDAHVELSQRPDKIVETALDTLKEFSPDEQGMSVLSL